MIGNKSSLISCVEMSLTYFGCYTGLSHLYLPLWGNMPKFYQRLIKDLFAKKMKILSLLQNKYINKDSIRLVLSLRCKTN